MTRPLRSKLRRWLAVTLLGLVLVLVFLLPVATARLFIWPPTDSPTKADAVIALGGDTGQLRAKQAIELAKAGYAPVAVISLGGTKPVPCPKPVPHVSIICFRADPLNTRGEAEFTSRLVARRHWDRIIVVSERSQATRARLLFERCTPVHLEMVPVLDPRSRLVYDVAYEWGALTKALVLARTC
ncbi:MAG: YdcF family protein [Acidimicrobiales bacterium]